ncbi:MAG: hypothetical protein HOL29_09530 [Euryarchaeota archaeon]|nr:hypothetical protein [Euryarchaeota archaeon]
MSVKDRRAGAKAAGVSLSDFKQGKTGAKAVARKTAQVNRNNPTVAPSGGIDPNATFTTAAGYEMESGAYNTRSKEMYEKYKAANPNSGMSNMTPDNASFDKDGYLSYDSTKPQWQANDMLKDAGYKQGDMLWKPGALDNLNGRKLTGRIARITELGNYIPEYEHDAVNSSHKSTGNAGYGGEVGLGADQYAYNRQYEQDNDVEYGQVNQQLQANGVSDQGGQQSFDNYGSSQSDFEAPPMAASNFEMPNVQQSIGPQYQGWQEQMGNASQSPYASRSKSSKMNFNFSPYKFQQGQ